MAERVVVIGGDAAGMSAASKAKRTKPELEVVVYTKGRYASYAACGIPYYIEGLIPRLENLIARTPEQFARQGIEVFLNHEVTAVDVNRHEVTVWNREERREFTDRYDYLVIATGAQPVLPPIEGVRAENVFVLRDLEDAERLQRFLGEQDSRHATVVGAGYIGLEMAEALRARGLRVTLVEMLPQVFAALDAPMAALVEEELVRQGVEVRTGEALQALEVDGRGWARVVHTASGRWETDLVLLGVGIRPQVALAQAAGIERDATGAIRTNWRMQTNFPHVYAAGDCVSVHHLVSEKRAYIPLGPAANKQGRVAGENIAGGHALFKGVVGTAVAKVFDLEVARTGLNEREAREAGFEPVASQITAQDRAGYYPGATPLQVRLVADRRTGRLLGGQLVGRSGAAQRVNVVAAALHARWGVEEFAQLDLGYAPPFAPVWDPLLIAAQNLLREWR